MKISFSVAQLCLVSLVNMLEFSVVESVVSVTTRILEGEFAERVGGTLRGYPFIPCEGTPEAFVACKLALNGENQPFDWTGRI